MRLFKLCLTTLFALSLLLPAYGAAAQVSQQMEIILDASGSMWGRVGSQPKITVAKEVLVELVESLADRKDLELGIRVYGHQSHRDKHDCLDSRLEIPFGPPDPAKVRALVKRITAQGYTPIAYSLSQAKNDFSDGEAKRTIVLITDGLESCEGDPCAAAGELFAAGLEVSLHVVGFDLKKAQLAKLQCLVEPSGGLLLGAADADQLKKALGEVVKKSLAENLVVKVTDTGGKPLKARATVFPAGSEKRAAARHGSRVGFKLPAGGYDLLVTGPNGAEKRVTGIQLQETEKTEITVRLGLARVLVSAADPAGKPLPIRVGVDAAGPAGEFQQRTWGQGDGDPIKFDLPPGKYRLRVEERRTRAKQESQPFTLGDGEQKEMKFTFGQARVTVWGGAPDGRPVPITLWVDFKTPAGSYEQRHWAKGKGDPVPVDLPPGAYRVRIREDRTRADQVSEDFILGDGEQKEMKFTFGQAQLTITAGDPAGQPVPARVWVEIKDRTGGYKQDKWAGYQGKPLVFTLSPGTFRVKILESRTKAEQVSPDFTLAHGGHKEMHFTFGQAKVTVSVADPAGSPIKALVYLDRKDATGNFKNETWGNAADKPAEFQVPPGEYRVRIQDRTTKASQTGESFTLKNGEQKQVKFVFGKARLLVNVSDPAGSPIKAAVYVDLKTAVGDYKSLTWANAADKPASFDLPPGEYRVRVQDRTTKATQTGEGFTLGNGEQKELKFSFGKSKVIVSVSDLEGKPIKAAVYVDLKNPVGDYKSLTWANAAAKPASFDLPPGEYRVRVQDRTTRATQAGEGFTLKNGEQKELKFSFGQAKLLVSVSDPDGKPIKAVAYLDAKNPVGDYKSLSWAKAEAKPASFDLPPGEYRVRVRDRTTKANQTGEGFTLKNGEQKELKFTFAQASLSVSGFTPDDKPLNIRVWVERKNAVGDFKSQDAADGRNKPAEFHLPPGEYRIRVENRKTRETRTEAPFTLKHGDRVSKRLTFE